MLKLNAYTGNKGKILPETRCQQPPDESTEPLASRQASPLHHHPPPPAPNQGLAEPASSTAQESFYLPEKRVFPAGHRRRALSPRSHPPGSRLLRIPPEKRIGSLLPPVLRCTSKKEEKRPPLIPRRQAIDGKAVPGLEGEGTCLRPEGRDRHQTGPAPLRSSRIARTKPAGPPQRPGGPTTPLRPCTSAPLPSGSAKLCAGTGRSSFVHVRPWSPNYPMRRHGRRSPSRRGKQTRRLNRCSRPASSRTQAPARGCLGSKPAAPCPLPAASWTSPSPVEQGPLARWPPTRWLSSPVQGCRQPGSRLLRPAVGGQEPAHLSPALPSTHLHSTPLVKRAPRHSRTPISSEPLPRTSHCLLGGGERRGEGCTQA